MKENGVVIEFLKQKDYIMINNNLGKGSFGNTVLLQDPFIQELFVAKKYAPESEEIKETFYKNFLDEIKILYKLNHKNIVRIFNYYAYEDLFCGYILMEYIDGTDIGTYITNSEIFDPIFLDKIFIQIIEGFKYIEDNNIIHRDIREGNILVDKTGTVKIIDFGIGKIFNKVTNCEDDSLDGSDTLPAEYYQGIYTSKTDMFYIAELFNRLIKNMNDAEFYEFSYQDILDKMMRKFPNERFNSFDEIKETMNKQDFVNLSISDKDKTIYQNFSNSIFNALASFTGERKFNYDTNVFLSKLEKALQDNCFENMIQKNNDIISCIVTSVYNYKSTPTIKYYDVKSFYDWFKKSTRQSQTLILTNIISKLTKIKIAEGDDDLPF